MSYLFCYYSGNYPPILEPETRIGLTISRNRNGYRHTYELEPEWVSCCNSTAFQSESSPCDKESYIKTTNRKQHLFSLNINLSILPSKYNVVQLQAHWTVCTQFISQSYRHFNCCLISLGLCGELGDLVW